MFIFSLKCSCLRPLGYCALLFSQFCGSRSFGPPDSRLLPDRNGPEKDIQQPLDGQMSLSTRTSSNEVTLASSSLLLVAKKRSPILTLSNYLLRGSIPHLDWTHGVVALLT